MGPEIRYSKEYKGVSKVALRIELRNGSFAGFCLTAWLCHRFGKRPIMLEGGYGVKRFLDSFFFEYVHRGFFLLDF